MFGHRSVRQGLAMVALVAAASGCHLLEPYHSSFPVEDGGARGSIDPTTLPRDGGPDLLSAVALPGPLELVTVPGADAGKADAGVYRPVGAAALSAELAITTVQCVTAKGVLKDYAIPIVDSPQVTFLAAAPALASAPAALRAWVGLRPAVIVIWDPNACDVEDPVSNNNDWNHAALLIRNATLGPGGALRLGDEVTPADMDVYDSTSKGVFTGDFAGIGDAYLSQHPQLSRVVTAAKAVLLRLALR